MIQVCVLDDHFAFIHLFVFLSASLPQKPFLGALLLPYLLDLFVQEVFTQAAGIYLHVLFLS